MKFTVDRKTWARGGYKNTALLTFDDTRCCLGFLGRACGIPDTRMLGIALPGQTKLYYRWPASLWKRAGDLANINDSAAYDDTEREAKLTEEFAKIGIEVKFIN